MPDKARVMAALWHPFTQMKGYKPLVIEGGKGSWLKDKSRNWYLDGVSSLWVNVHGHRHPDMDRAIRSQLKKVAHTTLLGLANPPAVKLAEKLVAIAPPGLKKVFYSDSGSEACEISLKIVFQYWQQCPSPQKNKTRFIHLDHSYHGDTLGAVSVGGIELFHNIYKPLLFKTLSSPSPYCYRCPFGQSEKTCGKKCLEKLEGLMARRHKELAGLIMEPLIQGAAGMITHPPGFLREVRRLTHKYNILLILDEVATGFGRTGTMFACERERVSPDILVIAKGLTGGYLPLAATLTTDKIYKTFLGEYSEKKTFFHGHTYTGNPLACSAALANLKVFKKERTLARLKNKIELLKELLLPFKDLPQVGQVRQCGFMVGIELVRDKKTREEYPWEEAMGIKVGLMAREKDIIIRPLGNVIVIMPPLSIKEWELRKLLQGIYASVKEVTENPSARRGER